MRHERSPALPLPSGWCWWAAGLGGIGRCRRRPQPGPRPASDCVHCGAPFVLEGAPCWYCAGPSSGETFPPAARALIDRFLETGEPATETEWIAATEAEEPPLGKLLHHLRMRAGDIPGELTHGAYSVARAKVRRLRLQRVTGRPYLGDFAAIDQRRSGVENDPSAGHGAGDGE